MPKPVAVLDANVLYPMFLTNFFMWLYVAGAYEPHWTDEIHAEWIRNVHKEKGEPIEKLEKRRDKMDQVAGNAKLSNYRRYKSRFSKTDAKDRHVAAAAVAAKKIHRADIVTIVTFNIRHFPPDELNVQGLRRMRPDEFIMELYRSEPDKVIEAARNQRRNYLAPPVTAAELLEGFRNTKLTEVAEALSLHMDELD